MLNRLFERYTGFLRSLKLVYVLNNLLNLPRLLPNRRLYRRYGLAKSVVAPVGSADFTSSGADLPWLDRPDAMERLEADPGFLRLDPLYREKARQFVRDGYCVLERFFDADAVAALNTDVDTLLASGRAGFNFTGRKIFNLHEHSRIARDRFFLQPELLGFMTFLLGRKLLPFQTLGFVRGSEQRAHSDSIHMTTEPKGYLIAAWIALEDCHAGNGPLFYYPGSHRLPYIMTGDYPSGNTRWTIGADSNRRYEDRIERLIRENGLERRDFLAQTGDVLIWHANLLHGGNPIRKEGATRRSMVCHYYAEDVLCYHELSQRPALLRRVRNAD